MSKERIGIIAPANCKYVPYITNYISIFKENNIDFKILTWNKADIDEEVSESLDFFVNDSNRKRMLLGYVKFSKKIKHFVKTYEIDRLIILTVAPAFFLGLPFLNKFKSKIVLDIRDDSPFVHYFPRLFNKICNLTHSIIVSSPLFNDWVKHKTIMCHNADVNMLKETQSMAVKVKNNGPVSIVYAGMMIEPDINIEILKSLKSDGRFIHYFVGRSNPGKEQIEKYVSENSLKNVFFFGTYQKDEIVDIYRNNADLVNIFRQNNVINRNALPNKLYDAVMSGVPVVVFKHNKAISDYVLKFNLGIVLEEKIECIGDELVNALDKFDYKAFEKGRTNFINKVLDDMKLFERTIIYFCR